MARRLARMLQAIGFWLAVCFSTACFFTSTALPAAAQSQGSLTMAFLEFQNKTGDPDLSHWRHAAAKLIAGQIFKVKSVRVLPPESNKYGYHQLKLKADDAIDSTKAR